MEGGGDLVTMAENSKSDARLERLENAIAGTLHALREEFHRTGSVSTRQEVLDLVAALFFAHVTSIDASGPGIGQYLLRRRKTSVQALNQFIQAAGIHHLARSNEGEDRGRLGLKRFFSPLSERDERFAQQLIQIFERDAAAFRLLHEAGRDDLINEVFSRFMSTSFVDEKEMGQYLTPPEIARFMVEVGLHALSPAARNRFLKPHAAHKAGVILDPSCGVGSFLAETIRVLHRQVRENQSADALARWLSEFVEKRVVGIDKSERMIRLAMVNLGLFGVKAAHLRLGNALAREGQEGSLNSDLDGRVELILTNPPFGATYSGAEIAGFAIGKGRARADSEVLFLERYIDWLAPGGIAVTVVPDSILVNRGTFAELRRWLRERCNVEAVFSLPQATFAAAGTSTKTSVLVLRKPDRKNVTEQLTFFGEAREVGFDVITRSGQRRRIRNSSTDLPILVAEYRGDKPASLGCRVHLAQDAERWDAAYHGGLPDGIAAVVDRPRSSLIKVSGVARLVDERVDPRRQIANEFDYIEISDVDTRTGLVGHKRLVAAEAPSRARKLIRSGDVLVSTVRPERGGVGLVPPWLDGAIASTGFAVLRCTGIHPLALVWLLKTEVVRQQMIRNNIGIAYPAISESACLDLVLPAMQGSVSSLSDAAAKLAAAQESFEEARRTFIAEVQTLDRLATQSSELLRQAPNVIDVGEPGAVADVA